MEQPNFDDLREPVVGRASVATVAIRKAADREAERV
jgi:hypothetical protein